MDEKPIGSIPFTDGIVRPVFLDAGGYILDDEGQLVYGVWVYIDEPEIVNRPSLNLGSHLSGSTVARRCRPGRQREPSSA
jgi:hypothetical protein